MKIVYAIDKCDLKNSPSIFLAGPTPRSPEVKSWRPEAINLLEEYGFDGVVFVPESEDGIWKQSYVDQIEWEHRYLGSCTYILMWVPRDLKTMLALTTNIEFGLYIDSGRIWYGRPDDAPNNAYLDFVYEKFTGAEPQKTLKSLIHAIMEGDNYVNGILRS